MNRALMTNLAGPKINLKGLCGILVLCSLNVLSGSSEAALRSRERSKPVPVCNLAWINGDILADGLGHNSFDPQYRLPFGAVTTEQGTVTLRFRTCLNDVTQVRVRLWNSVARKELWIPMSRETNPASTDPSLGPIEYWSALIPIPTEPTLLYYFFEVSDSNNTHYYNSDNSPIGNGGWGKYNEHWNDHNTYGITVYSRSFRTPDWFKGSVMYQILPDRFRNGDPSNDPITGEGFVFGKTFLRRDWNQPICDPRGPECKGQQDNQFYGGDLQGVIQKLDYLRSLGVKTLYFNPIFLSATNHRYDTQDYFKVDPKLGSNELFDQLVAETQKRNMKLVLDGVFNHGSADSPYFDLFRRWNGVGACESVDSMYRSWFYFPHFAMQPLDHARPGTYYYCTGADGTLTTYEAWWSYYEHPVYRKNSPVIRDFFFTGGPDAVGPYWIRKGASGWRLDVGGDVAPGEGVDPSNDFWQGFRTAIKGQDPEAVIIGEEWTNASSWLLGHEWDSATNYRFRTLVLNWLADRCQGAGCVNGRIFQDNDNSFSSSNGPISPIDERDFDRRLRVIEQDTPREAWLAMMNPLGSHDTQRLLFVLKKISGDDIGLARRKLFLASLFQFTYPGVPVIYYGDEAGVAAEGMYYENEWKDDPYNRAVYPWLDQGLTPDAEITAHYAKIASIRNSNTALQRGGFETLSTDVKNRIYAYRRLLDPKGSQAAEAIVVLNRSPEQKDVKITVPSSLSRPFLSGEYEDLLNGGTYKVVDDALDCGKISGLWGRILSPKRK